ncbi:3-hydroxyacyl-ACP dehydratase FabZ family protein [Kaarinaea lacus]
MSEAAGHTVIDCCISPDHPAIEGHFPGNPVVPGVVILDQVISSSLEKNPSLVIAGIESVKFTAPLRPGSHFSIHLEPPKNKYLSFECRLKEQVLARGKLILSGS